MLELNKDEAAKIKKKMEEKENSYKQIIGQQSYEIDWLKNNLASSNTIEERKGSLILGTTASIWRGRLSC